MVALQIPFLKALFLPWESTNSLNFRRLLYPWICAISGFLQDGKCSARPTSWEVQLAHCSPLQPPDSEPWSSTQERKGPQLCPCLQQGHNEDMDGSQLENFMSYVSVFMMVTEVNIQEGGDSSKSLIFCCPLSPFHACWLPRRFLCGPNWALFQSWDTNLAPILHQTMAFVTKTMGARNDCAWFIYYCFCSNITSADMQTSASPWHFLCFFHWFPPYCYWLIACTAVLLQDQGLIIPLGKEKTSTVTCFPHRKEEPGFQKLLLIFLL